MANLRKALFSTIPRILHSTAASGRSSIHRSPIRFETLHGSILKPFVGSFSRFYSSNQSLDIDLANEESKRRLFNRLLYRSKQRGYLELDLVLGKWVEDHIQSMDEDGIKALVDVLDLNPIDHHALRIIISVVSSLM
ncbi:hypothetical protein F0562_024482 [Nyssa sinensis]|uniref:Succinate dehydrogenase assembly factor 2, mitochondrial n=1 Tax=Nyssa sinensis TaxID=561372 RepID=A0A5J5BD01_9ASTE|nr:hypothetical protein F0562_024482 [Nyssa sinensis]